jgi:predicted transcriptional regulator
MSSVFSGARGGIQLIWTAVELDTAALLFRVSLPIETLASALKDLEVNGLLRRRIEDGRELIQLTRTGEQVARAQL